jgi:hypothetical protein
VNQRDTAVRLGDELRRTSYAAQMNLDQDG